MQTRRACVIGYSYFQATVIRALFKGGLPVACVATHVLDTALDPDLRQMLADRDLRADLSNVARDERVEYLHLPDVNAAGSIDAIKRTGANVVVSCSAPILSKQFIEAFSGQVFNYHGSLRYRGRAAWSWLIMSGANQDSVVLHWVDTGIDTGDHIAEARFSWDENAYPIDVAAAQRQCFVDLSGRLAAEVQSDRPSVAKPSPPRSYLPALNTALDGWIDWSWSANEVSRAVRAFGWPYGGASSLLERPDRTVEAVSLARSESVNDTTVAHPLMVGCVVDREAGSWIDVQCGKGVLRIHSLRDGNGEQAAARTVRLGSRFRPHKIAETE